jgi:hypothetical protein
MPFSAMLLRFHLDQRPPEGGRRSNTRNIIIFGIKWLRKKPRKEK